MDFDVDVKKSCSVHPKASASHALSRATSNVGWVHITSKSSQSVCIVAAASRAWQTALPSDRRFLLEPSCARRNGSITWRAVKTPRPPTTHPLPEFPVPAESAAHTSTRHAGVAMPYPSKLLIQLSATRATFSRAGHLEWLPPDGTRIQDYLYTIRFPTRTVSFGAQRDEV
jgi:hypothetical protein